MSKDIISSAVKQLDIVDICRLLHPTAAGYVFFMSSHGIFNKTDYILVHKIHPNILKKKKKERNHTESSSPIWKNVCNSSNTLGRCPSSVTALGSYTQKCAPPRGQLSFNDWLMWGCKQGLLSSLCDCMRLWWLLHCSSALPHDQWFFLLFLVGVHKTAPL